VNGIALKQRPTSDFPIGVIPSYLEEPDLPPELLGGVYEAYLHRMIRVAFVPEFTRPPGWPPTTPTYEPRDVQGARSHVAMAARYTVTPSARGTATRFYGHVPDWPVSLFLVSHDDFRVMSEELEQLTERGWHKGWKVSEIRELRVTRLLVEEIIPSDRFEAQDRYWLTDPECR
jgi:hypothetical protein